MPGQAAYKVLRVLLQRYPDDWTVQQVLDALDAEESVLQQTEDKCRRCGRAIIENGDNWTHISPGGDTSRTCKSAAYDDPKPGDTERQEWFEWPEENKGWVAAPAN